MKNQLNRNIGFLLSTNTRLYIPMKKNPTPSLASDNKALSQSLNQL